MGDPFPIQADTAIADSNGIVYVTGGFIVDDCVVEGDDPGAVCALDANLRPRWMIRISDDSAGLNLLGGRLTVSRYPDVCIALDPSTGAILDADAPLLPTRMVPDEDGSFLSDHDGEVRRYRLGDRAGESEGLRFGFDRVPLFEPPPARGFFAKLFTSDEPPSADGTFPIALGGGDLVTFQSGPAALVRYDRAGNRSRFASISASTASTRSPTCSAPASWSSCATEHGSSARAAARCRTSRRSRISPRSRRCREETSCSSATSASCSRGETRAIAWGDVHGTGKEWRPRARRSHRR